MFVCRCVLDNILFTLQRCPSSSARVRGPSRDDLPWGNTSLNKKHYPHHRSQPVSESMDHQGKGIVKTSHSNLEQFTRGGTSVQRGPG